MAVPKEKTLFKHTRMRFMERYGIFYTKHVHDLLCAKIKKGEGTFIENQSLRVTVWELEYENKKFKVCYDKNRKTLITVLPPPEHPDYIPDVV